MTPAANPRGRGGARTMLRRAARGAVGPLSGVALAALTLGGCTVGPDFKAPAPPAVTAYTAPDEAGRPAAGARRQAVALGAPADAVWWRSFGSPALDRLVRAALAGSPTIEAARARLAEAHYAVAATTGALFPQVGLNASVAREKLSPTTFGLSPTAFPLPPNFNLYQVGPTVSYALDLFGATRRQIEKDAALADMRAHELDAATLTLSGNTVLQAIDLASAEARIRAADDIVALDRQNVALVAKARAAGSVPDSDVILTQSQLAADETLRPALDQELSVARHALAVLLGRAPAAFAPPGLRLADLTPPAGLGVSLPSGLVHQRPDILAAEANLHAASAQIGIATAQLYPAVTLSAGISSAALQPGQLFNPSTLIWSIAAGLAQPVFDGGMRESERQAALAGFKAAAADYQQTVLEAFRQVADLLQALVHDADLVAAQKRAVDTAAQAVALQRYSYARGASGLLDLLDVQRQYQHALLGSIQAEAQRLRDTAQLLVAMGGAPPPQLLSAAR